MFWCWVSLSLFRCNCFFAAFRSTGAAVNSSESLPPSSSVNDISSMSTDQTLASDTDSSLETSAGPLGCCRWLAACLRNPMFFRRWPGHPERAHHYTTPPEKFGEKKVKCWILKCVKKKKDTKNHHNEMSQILKYNFMLHNMNNYNNYRWQKKNTLSFKKRNKIIR